ncbi:MAG: hypothetical protein JNM36_07770, partial [Chitinophagales bacterium]|nr:hypothetical protein [Chitinophagales bacterium]
MPKKNNNPLRIPYDKLWKSITSDYFEDFLAMFLPDLYAATNLNIPFKALEKELKAIVPNKTNRQADKLVGVHLKDGDECWVYVHIEFENSHQPNIKERMYDYYSLIQSKYGKEITALVIYTGRHVPKDPHIYRKETYGTTLSYEFNTYCIVEQDEAALIANPNAFAIVVLANLYVLRTYEDVGERLNLKEQIYLLARKRNYSEIKIHHLLLFLDELMQLPEELERQFVNYISEPQKSNDMVYISHRGRALIDVWAKKAYGKSITEQMEESKTIIAQSKAELKESKAVIK